MSDVGPPPDGNYEPQPPDPEAPWPPDHTPAEPLNPTPPPEQPTAPPDPEPQVQRYDVWEGTETTPIVWTKMAGVENNGLEFDVATARAMELEGLASGARVPPTYVSHHVAVAIGTDPNNPPPLPT